MGGGGWEVWVTCPLDFKSIPVKTNTSVHNKPKHHVGNVTDTRATSVRALLFPSFLYIQLLFFFVTSHDLAAAAAAAFT